MSVKKFFGISRDLVKNGRVFEIGEMKFRLAYMGSTNSNWEKVSARIYKPFRYQIDKDLLSEAKADELMIQVFVESILLGWENVRLEDDGPLLEFSDDNAKALMKSFPELHFELRKLAGSFVHYKEDVGDAETDAKN